MKTDLFQSCGHCQVFQICWRIECQTLTASSFRILHKFKYIFIKKREHDTLHTIMSDQKPCNLCLRIKLLFRTPNKTEQTFFLITEMTQIHYRKKEEEKIEQNRSNLWLFPSMNFFLTKLRSHRTKKCVLYYFKWRKCTRFPVC